MITDYCPNCGNKETWERLSNDEGYCPKCDVTFKATEGKIKPQPKGRLKELEDRVDRLETENQKLKKDLYGKEESFF